MRVACRAAMVLLWLGAVPAACSREVSAEPDQLAAERAVPHAAAASALVATQAPSAPALEEHAGAAFGELESLRPRRELATVLFSEHDAEVATRIDGVVRSFAVELGDRVSSGHLLAILEDDGEQAALQSAQATLELTRLEQARALQLREQNMISQADLDQAAYRVRLAEAAVQEANVRLSYTRIRAPFEGVISRRFIRIGQSVERGDPLFRVTALSPLRAQARVPELEARHLRVGQSLDLRGVAGDLVGGSVLRIAPAVDPASGTVEVLIGVEGPGALRPGSAVAVVLPDPAARP